MPEIHAKLSASGAKRWMNCPRSVALEALFPESTSQYAEEGTRAHAAAESLLNSIINKDNELYKRLDKELLAKDPEMHRYVSEYVNFCLDQYHQALLTHSAVSAFVEERLNFSKYVPGGFGTGDFVLIYKNKLIINDLKYGKGVQVSANENPQLRLYALGALEAYGWIYDIEEIEMNIIQPRLNSIESEVITAKDLKKWAKTEVVNQAKLANENKGSFKPGEAQCKFCKARALCKERAKHVLSTIQSILEK